MVRVHPTIANRVPRYLMATAAAVVVVSLYRSILHVNQTTAALTFLVLIELAAIRWGLRISLYLSILSAFLYDCYFLPPFHTLVVRDRQNWLALLAFIASAVLISRLSEIARQQAESSEDRRQEMERLYGFSRRMLLEQDLSNLARKCPGIVASSFALEKVALYLAENDSVYFLDPQDEFVSVNQLRAVAQAPDAPGFPVEGARVVPLMLGMRSSGAVAMTDGRYPDGLYQAIAGLLAIALARAAALERFSRVEAAREGERLRGALLDSLTHELRTPLTAIHAAASSLISQPTLHESQRREMYSIIDDESIRLDRLIGRAVDMAQLDTAGIQLRLKPQRFQEIVDKAVKDSYALLRGRAVSVGIPESLPPIPMDGELIRRVLLHLLENAAKYSPAGTPVRISAKLVEERLLVSIQDEGQGIDEAEQSLIFGKFYRGSRQRQGFEGTGMGLAIAKAILLVHNGGIDVISRPNQGATFNFWIPLRHSAVD